MLSKRTVVCGQKRHGEPDLTSEQLAKADYVVVRTFKGLVLIKSRSAAYATGQRVHEERTRFI